MTKQPAKSKPMPIKWGVLIDLMSANGWNMADAGRTIQPNGKPLYSPAYMDTRAFDHIRKDERFCKALEEKKKEITEKSTVTREKVLKSIQWGIDRATATGNLSALKGFLELQGKAIAMYSDKVISEDSDAQKALDERKALEAKRLANIRLREQAG